MYDFVDEVVGKHSIHSFNELPGMTLFLYDRKNIKWVPNKVKMCRESCLQKQGAVNKPWADYSKLLVVWQAVNFGSQVCC